LVADLAFKPIISEASWMISDLHRSPVFFASPGKRGDGMRRGKP
jgi:hypothetical protein